MAAGEHLGGIGEIKAAMRQRGGPLGRIESDLHRLNVTTKTPRFKPGAAFGARTEAA